MRVVALGLLPQGEVAVGAAMGIRATACRSSRQCSEHATLSCWMMHWCLSCSCCQAATWRLRAVSAVCGVLAVCFVSCAGDGRELVCQAQLQLLRLLRLLQLLQRRWWHQDLGIAAQGARYGVGRRV